MLVLNVLGPYGPMAVCGELWETLEREIERCLEICHPQTCDPILSGQSGAKLLEAFEN